MADTRNVLTEDERRQFNESVQRVRRLAVEHLQRSREPGTAVSFVANLHRGVDQCAARAAALGPVPECTIGCSYCCRVRVEATAAEVFRIARAIRELDEVTQARWLEALRAHVAQSTLTQAKGVSGEASARRDCSFLEAGRCAIYAIRPAVCRKAHSLSVNACEHYAPVLPQNLTLAVEADALMAGTSMAYRDANLQAGAHELNAAVLHALSDASAEARWFAGDAVFAIDGA